MHSVTLNNGVQMPVLGVGVYQIAAGADTERVVALALEMGYRLIDTAALYKNERSVGQAVKASGIRRSEIFVTTKLHPLRVWGVENAFYRSSERLGLDYVDLYLIHWPFLRKKRIWQVLQSIYEKGHARAIGVSNFRIKDIESLTGIVPAVNQVEFHPFLYRKRLLEYCQSRGIQLEAHSPLTHGKRITDARIQAIADRYGKSPAQLLIRWSVQHGLVAIPKTHLREEMQQNSSVFEFFIDEKDMAALDALNENYHVAGLSRIIGDPA